MKTPYFLINKEELNNNIDSFAKALKELWPNSYLGYSVKTNSLPWLLEYLYRKNVYAEVVSDEEYHLAELMGYPHNKIIFNGPIKEEACFKIACDKQAIINMDSKQDLFLLSKYGKATTNIGIRVNLPPSIFDEDDIGYESDGFRFGFCEENGDFKDALDAIHRSCGDIRVGLHLHCNSITRSKNVYIAIAQYAVSLIKKYNLKVAFIDMGGGYFGGVPGKTTPYEYIQAIKDVLQPHVNPVETTLIVEPGSAIIGSVVDLHTTVLDVKDTLKTRIVTTDGSRIHIDPLWIKNRYMYSLVTSNKDKKRDTQLICGYTCMDHDRLMTIKNEDELQVGDQIIYQRVGAYSVTFGGLFINYHPDVYVFDGDNTTKVRSRINTEDYIKIHS